MWALNKTFQLKRLLQHQKFDNMNVQGVFETISICFKFSPMNSLLNKNIYYYRVLVITGIMITQLN
jgi:hypothetical protein